MTRPKRPTSSRSASKTSGGKSTTSKGSRGHAPKKMTAQGRGGITRDTTRPVREPGEGTKPAKTERRDDYPKKTPGETAGSSARRYGSASSTGEKRSAGSEGGTTRRAPPKIVKKKSLPELKRVQLNAPPASMVFVDRDGEKITFPDSNLKRMAAQILTDKRKAWRYRPFSFPLFTDKGNEQTFNFDFYIYDAEDSVIRLILVIPHESREVWDKVGRFKRQYPMYHYELWTPEKLAQLSGPRGRLGF